jgi:carbon-monoxide dehydrogenase large subunit
VISIDTTRAVGAPGVLAVLTGSDASRDRLGDIYGMFFGEQPSDQKVHRPGQPVLARERVRHIGDRVALIVAETLAQAQDAGELIDIEYESLPHVSSSEVAFAAGAPKVWEEADSNVCFWMEHGDKTAADAAFAHAAHVTSLAVHYPRASANPMEPRSALGIYDTFERRYTLYTGSQQPHRTREFIANTIFHIAESDIRVITPNVGGSFGSRGTVYAEEVLVLWASRLIGRPVKWTAVRSESFVSDMHGRDPHTKAELALDTEGRILGLRASTIANLGAYLVYSAGVPPHNAVTTLSGPYHIPVVHARVDAVFTNTNSLGPFRGSGRPEMTFVLERLIEKAARELDIDPIEMRRRNLVSPEAMPYVTPGGAVLDCGDLTEALDRTLSLADWNGIAARKDKSAQKGMLRGFGLCLHAETAGLMSERMEIFMDPSGSVTVHAGTADQGQGHKTMYSQMIASWLGVPLDRIRVHHGDTDKVAFGRGTFGARSAMIGGSALLLASQELIAKGKAVAAKMLDAGVDDVEFADGIFKAARTNRSVPIKDVARRAYSPAGYSKELGIGLEGRGTFGGPKSFPYGCMVCEVEIDPSTGCVRIERLSFVDDVGVIINPLTVEGQAHGSTAQGIGQVLLEEIVFDPESGQLLSGTFMDYCMPRADDLPSFESDFIVTPATGNPLGVKGGSESGNFGAPPAVVNAILDALKPFGIEDIALPATPNRIWDAINRRR